MKQLFALAAMIVFLATPATSLANKKHSDVIGGGGGLPSRGASGGGSGGNKVQPVKPSSQSGTSTQGHKQPPAKSNTGSGKAAEYKGTKQVPNPGTYDKSGKVKK